MLTWIRRIAMLGFVATCMGREKNEEGSPFGIWQLQDFGLLLALMVIIVLCSSSSSEGKKPTK
jgi:Co/Zn/Cd efflux system component